MHRLILVPLLPSTVSVIGLLRKGLAELLLFLDLMQCRMRCLDQYTMCNRMIYPLLVRWWCCSLRLMRPLLASASGLPAESASCFQRSAAFESLVKPGKTMEGIRGKLRCRC